MVGFYIKKAFFDGWDNLIMLIILNLGYVVLLGGLYLVVSALQISIILGLAVLILWTFVMQSYNGAVSFFTYYFACYQRPGIREFLDYGKQAFRYVPLMSVLTVGLLVMLFIVLPFYLAVPGFLSVLALSVIFWITLFLSMSMMFYFPAAVQLKNNPPWKTFKKSMLIALDNLGFSLFLLIYTVINSIISIFTAFLIPGFASVLMSHQIALKLRLVKYDFLEENPDTPRKDIPWGALLMEEREKVGPRTLRGMIFPWKE